MVGWMDITAPLPALYCADSPTNSAGRLHLQDAVLSVLDDERKWRRVIHLYLMSPDWDPFPLCMRPRERIFLDVDKWLASLKSAEMNQVYCWWFSKDFLELCQFLTQYSLNLSYFGLQSVKSTNSLNSTLTNVLELLGLFAQIVFLNPNATLYTTIILSL